jgi:hypothetical protein
MRGRILGIANLILLLAATVSVAHLGYWLYNLRPRPPITGLVPIPCGDVLLRSQADYLAVLSQDLIKKGGGLPGDNREITRLISNHAKELGYDWPGEYKIGSNGEICDCFGRPFEINVGQDRVTVTSPSMLTYSFARNAPIRQE